MKCMEVTKFNGKYYYLVPTPYDDCHGCDFEDPWGCAAGCGADCIRSDRVILKEQEKYERECRIENKKGFQV